MRIFKTHRPYIALLLCVLLLPGFFWRQKSSQITGSVVASSSAINSQIETYQVAILKKRSDGTFEVKFVNRTRIPTKPKTEESPKRLALPTSESNPIKNADIKTINVNQEASEPAPIIEHALDTIDRTNGLKSFFGVFSGISNRYCKSCEEEIRNMRYMQCDNTNDYLEKQISEVAEKPGLLGDMLHAEIRSNSIIKPSCIRTSMNMKFGEKSKNFRQCSSAGRTVAFRPCISNQYFKLINNSFDLVSSCMKDFMAPNESNETKKLDIRAIYALINVESGFHINATSGTGAGGIGQFTEAAIKDVNANELDNVRGSLSSHTNPQCRRIARDMLSTKTPMNPSIKSCDRISIKSGNPLKNMIYTFAYLKGVKKDLNRTIFNNRRYKNKFDLSEYDLNKVRRALMVWSHNAGPAGTWTPAKSLLNTVYRNKRVTNADKFINQLQQYMQKFPSRANDSAIRRKETSHYFPSITKTLSQIEDSAGGGTCVNF